MTLTHLPDFRTRPRTAGGIALLVGISLAFACTTKDSKKRSGPDKNLEDLKQSGKQLKDQTDDLLRKRGQLSRSRDELQAARKALEEKRANLGADDVAGHASLATEEKALKEKEKSLSSQEEQVNDKLLGALQRQEQFYAKATAALAAKGGDADGTSTVRARELSVASRESSVAQREKDLAGRERALAEEYRKVVAYKAEKCATATPIYTTIASPTMPSVTGGRTFTEADARASSQKVQGLMASRGIRLGDLPGGFSALLSDIDKAIRAKEYTRAKVAADQLYNALKAIKVDRGFVGAKMARLAGQIRGRKLSEANREKVNKPFVEVTNAYNDGRFETANRMINLIYGLLR
jgi:hypothetical protein